MSATVNDVLSVLDDAFPFAWADPWDRVGLSIGDRNATVNGVFVTLDTTAAAIERAAELRANVIVTHHPAYLEPPAPLVPGFGPAGVCFAAISAGIALIACHTNLDRAPAGSDALPTALGLEILGALEHSQEPVVSIITYVAADAVEVVVAAATVAGAGRVGEYEGCAFESSGHGRFRARVGASPAVGSTRAESGVDEVRIEVTSPPTRAAQVASAIRAAHPYEEPLIVMGESSISRGVARMGRVCGVPRGTSLADLAQQVAVRFGITPRVYGDATREIRRVGTANGSGRSLIDAARSAECDVLLTGELRYHEALEAAASGLAVIEAGHDVTEWPMVPVLGAVLRSVPGILPEAVTVDAPSAAWWTP